MNQTTDAQQLITACIQQKSWAQKELVLQYSANLFTVARRYAVDNHKAKDILQDSFILIFKNIRQYNSNIGKFENWLRRIVVNTALKEFRQKHTRYETSVDTRQENDKNYTEDFCKIDFDIILKLIQKLPSGYREIFNLHVMEEYTHEEIGELLNISAGTSRSQLSRARKILQEQVKAYQNELERI